MFCKGFQQLKLTGAEIYFLFSPRNTAGLQVDLKVADLQNNTKPTRQESVNDHPTNIDRYILIRFHSTNSELSPSVAYLYRKMDTCYLEQPYSGIWELEASVLDAIAADL